MRKFENLKFHKDCLKLRREETTVMLLHGDTFLRVFWTYSKMVRSGTLNTRSKATWAIRQCSRSLNTDGAETEG